MLDVLTLKQLAEHLQLSERTVYRLLGRGQLPGFKVGGHWRFRRSVVDYWMDLRMGRMTTAELRELDREWYGSTLPLSDALSEENALVPLSGTGRRDIIGRFIEAVTFPEPVDATEVFARVWQREQLASTATAGGAAFLHTARWDGGTMHRHDLLAIGRLDTPIDFGAPDGSSTDVLLLLLARDARQHLVLLAKAARLCREPGFLQGLRSATSPRDVLMLVRHSERLWFTDGASPRS